MDLSEFYEYEKKLSLGLIKPESVSNDDLWTLFKGITQLCGFSIKRHFLDFEAWCIVKYEIERRRLENTKNEPTP